VTVDPAAKGYQDRVVYDVAGGAGGQGGRAGPGGQPGAAGASGPAGPAPAVTEAEVFEP
jgi:hypothetical protein